MSRHASQAPGDHGIVEPKLDVFLSHSGAQKGFAWQLYEDLRRRDFKPFFDKDRVCLPIGQNFPENIFKSIRGCQVGVVILSEEFFTLSHWPMTELVCMVDQRLKILPIFLGISPEDLSKQTNLDDWKSSWQGWAGSDERIKLSEWEAAMNLLRGLNGLVYNHAEGLVEFRKRIVAEISGIVRPSYRWDDSYVQGRSRLSQILRKEIKRTELREGGFQVVGFHGVGGIGKTTACKSLCKDLFQEFDGRVCHLELENDTKDKEKAWLRDVLIRLTCIDKKILKDKSIDECWSLLKEHVQWNKVFLAIDNVNSKSLDEAKKYLNVKYCKGSIVMVTARAHLDFRALGIDFDSCHAVPELNKEEAQDLFLYYAKPKSEVEKVVVMRCVKRCYFSKGDGSFHYHPLALRVLGSELGLEDPNDWDLQLKEEDVFNQRGELENGVFDILRRSFDLLNDEDKLLFMDVALFDCKDELFDRYWLDYYRSKRYFETSGDSETCGDSVSSLYFGTSGDSVPSDDYDVSCIDTGRTWCIREWLRVLHDDVDRRLKRLKSKSLVEELSIETNQIQMHDLWREFALLMRGSRGGRWVYELVGGKDMSSVLSSGRWKEIERICVTTDDFYDLYLKSVKRLDLSSCSNVKVFRLVDVTVSRELDLSALKQLRTLEIVSLLEPYSGTSLDINKVRGIQFLSKLTWLIWLNISVHSVDAIEAISHLSCLQVLQLKCMSSNSPLISLDLSKLVDLREVRIGIGFLKCITGLSKEMTALRILDLRLCLNLRSCSGVDCLFSLEELMLRECRSVEDLPNLEKLTKLRLLVVQRCLKLVSIRGVGSLVALQELRVEDMPSLEELPDMSYLTKLGVLYLERCPSLKCIPGLDKLVALRELFVDVELLIITCDVYLTHLRNGRDVYLAQLSKLRIRGDGYGYGIDRIGKPWIFLEDEIKNLHQVPVLNFSMMQSVLDLTLYGLDLTLTNLSELTSLKRLRLDKCGMENLLDMGTQMRLESLSISGCGSLRGWDGVRRLGSCELVTGVDWHCDWTLPYLEKLILYHSKDIQLPDLSHFPRLRKLKLHLFNRDWWVRSNCTLLCRAEHEHLEIFSCKFWNVEKLPDLSKFPRLRKLLLRHCDSLKSLTCSYPHHALECMELPFCNRLHEFPSVDVFPRLRSLTVMYCGGKLNELEVEKLKSRGFRYVNYLQTWTLERELWTDKITLESEPSCNLGAGSGLHGPEDVVGVSSGEVVPCSSEFVPYVESISECAPVPNRVILEQDLNRKLRLKGKAPME